MDEISYAVRGFLTIRRHSLRAPLSGSLTVHVDEDSGAFTGDLDLGQSAISRTVFGASVLRATVQIMAESPVTGHFDHETRLSATVTVNAAITGVRTCGRTLLRGGRCRTATHAVVPMRSQPGFDLAQGGRLVGEYSRPPFTGCGWLTPVINLLAAGPGNAVVIDLIPRDDSPPSLRPLPAVMFGYMTEGPGIRDGNMPGWHVTSGGGSTWAEWQGHGRVARPAAGRKRPASGRWHGCGS